MRIRDFKIRSKLLLIYIFCVAIPIIITDAAILSTVSRSAKEKQWKEYQYVVERVEYNLTETIKGCILFASNLYKDRGLDDFLSKSYEDNMAYYTAYLDILNNERLSYSYNNGVLYKIQVFTDNDTILSGGYIAKIESIQESDWYQAYMKNGQDIYLHTHYDEGRKRVAGGGTSRTISIIRNMNHFTKKGKEKLLKIDIDYNFMLKDVMNEKLDANLYIKNREYILFSNRPSENSMTEFDAVDEIEQDKVIMKTSINVGNEEWDIVIVEQDSTPGIFLFENQSIWVLIVLNLLIPSLLIYVVGRSISSRLTLVVAAMDNVKIEKYEVINTLEGEDEVGELIRSYNLMVMKIKNLIEVVFKGKEEQQLLVLSKNQAELKALQSQVNPHFLFNTLETIRMRSFMKEEEETATIIGELATLFRKSMDWRYDYSTVQEEVSFVNKYINIQRYRFGDKIRFISSIKEDCMNYYLPKLGISTFVENACIHGIEASVRDGIIYLDIKREEEYLKIKIIDNGRGFDEYELRQLKSLLDIANNELLYEQKSTGMLNSYIRFQMFCEGNCKFDITSQLERGTNIIIEIPLRYVIERG